ncbi:hypothetical protein [Thermodesulfobacterium hveragerdense]|uniref:hypothetical protein n=1 Tax=Thermodesulfobacterium hveragerdense TaxID=53424 RepID=UPI0004002022|nr:hypothetical protein [Thermodesulfobacterium hveragerdense]
MQITAPAPILYLPENLWFLFSRPGRELVIRVVGIEGKTLNLELGGEKFQARIAGTVNPEDFKVGENIRVKVLQTGNPVVLQVVSGEKTSNDLKILYLLSQAGKKEEVNIPYVKEELKLLSNLLTDLFIKKDKKSKSLEEGIKELLGDKVKASTLLYQEDSLFIPFLFNDERSWGYIELGPPQERKGKIKLFYLKFYGEYLGLVECFISYDEREILLELYFYTKEAYELAKIEHKNLKNLFIFSQNQVIIKISYEESLPGSILEKRV